MKRLVVVGQGCVSRHLDQAVEVGFDVVGYGVDASRVASLNDGES